MKRIGWAISLLRAMPACSAALCCMLFAISACKERRQDRAASRPITARVGGMEWAPAPLGNAYSVRNSLLRTSRGSDEIQTPIALAWILSGQPARAIPQLRRVAERAPVPASFINLSAALYEDGRVTGDAQELIDALVAADRAIENSPRSQEALFNRVLVLDELGLNKPAARAARNYLAIDGMSSWASEIRDRLPRLEKTAAPDWMPERNRLENAVRRGDTAEVTRIVRRFPAHARVWAEKECLGTWGELVVRNDSHADHQLAIARAVGTALTQFHGESLVFDAVRGIDEATDHSNRLRLARGLASLTHAQTANGANRFAETIRSFEEARSDLRTSYNPMAAVAAYSEAAALFHANRLQDSNARLDEAWSATSAGHHALRAQIKWMRGLLLGVGGRLNESLKEFREAGDEFRAIDEKWFVRRMDNFVADLLARLGDSRGAYRYRRATFASASEAGDDAAVHGFVHTAALHEIMEERWPAAIALLDLICDDAAMESHLHADALMQRAYAHVRNGESVEAGRDLAACRRLAATIPDQALVARTLTDADFVEAAALETIDPRRGASLASHSIEFAESHKRTFRLPELYLQRARCSIAVGDDSAAIADLDRSLALYERRRLDVKAEALRDSFSGTARPIFDEYLRLVAQRSENDRLFDVAERSRARLLLDRFAADKPRSTIPTPAEIGASIPSQTVILEYVTLPDSLVILAIGNARFRVTSVDVRADALSALIARMRQAIDADHDREAISAAQMVYTILIAPAAADLAGASTVVVCPDLPLERVPFAALADAGGRFLIEDFALVVAPSATAFARGTSMVRPVSVSALVIGDPAFNGDLFPNLPRLTGAVREAREIAGMYSQASLLTGDSATVKAVLRGIGFRSVVHVAAHAVVNERDPATSAILLAPDGDSSGVLYAGDIAKLRLRATLVTLAGCRTAEAGSGRGSMRSLAMAFLVAGSSSVVATLWDLDDVTARQTMIAFHRGLHDGLTPARALRDAQIAAIRSSSPQPRALKSWAAIQLYGTRL